MERDPVCGMTVDPSRAKAIVQRDGKPYYFCCEGCAAKFRGQPDRYVDDPARALAQAPGAVMQLAGGAGSTRVSTPSMHAAHEARVQKGSYICPMDPEVRQDHPGACPKCGMALEPRVITETEPENHELVDMTRRVGVSVALTVPLVALAMSEPLPGRVRGWIELGLASPVVLWAARPFFERMWTSVK